MYDRVMAALGYTLFDTAIGPCGLAWGARGILGVQLPEQTGAATRARLRQRFPPAVETAPPPELEQVVARIVALLGGETADLSHAPLDMDDVPAFDRRVLEAARAIPPGVTASYGDLARAIGEPGTARAVGRALGRNPFPILVPCHRVLAAGGRMGGFSAPGGVDTKLRLLSIEGSVLPLFGAPVR
jgi:methylated-DNA-[protein]-cysteine S-methyltransferase